ncbi:MAG: penicillin-binding protein 2, partial [Burkholderiales bacterium]
RDMNRKAELRDYQRELYRFKTRLTVAVGVALALFAVLGVRLYYLQILQHEHYQTLAENNRIAVVPIPATRGLIMDRNGVLLASNYSAYTLEITPSRAPDLERTLDELALLVRITPQDRKRFKKLQSESHDFESLPIRLRLDEDEVARFAVNRYRFPGVDIRGRLFRHYPKAHTMAHVVGYVGRINEAELEQLEATGELANYRGSDHIGKIGVEQSYQKQLHGITGFQQVETDSLGRAVRVLSRTAPLPGTNIYLSIDAGLQDVAERAFGDYRGALVAIDPKSGETLAFLSKPGFDPNPFVDGIDNADWDALINDPDRPLNNRALRGVYPPGSTIKPFMALAALESGKRRPADAIQDPGFFSLPGSSHRYRDWKVGGHGYVDMHRSIVVSCDSYYYRLALDLGIDYIHRFMTSLGLGRKTGIDIEGEAAGLMPSPAWKQKRFKQPWYAGETVISGIGQGYTLVTPLQLAFAVALLANNGSAYLPRLVRKFRDGTTNAERPGLPKVLRQLALQPTHLQLVKQAMIDVTRPGGTAAGAGMNAGYSFAGKTGTAQVIGMKQSERYDALRVDERHRDHSLFIAFAPAETPAIALAVLVENGGHGSTTAAPIARKVLDYYLLGKPLEDPKAADLATPEAGD